MPPKFDFLHHYNTSHHIFRLMKHMLMLSSTHIYGSLCAFLSRGTLQALQDFSHSGHSVLPIVFLAHGPSYLELPCSFRLIPHHSPDHCNSTRGDLAWSPRLRETDSYFVFSLVVIILVLRHPQMSEWFHITVKPLDILVAIKTWSYFLQIWQIVLLNNIAYPAFKMQINLYKCWHGFSSNCYSVSHCCNKPTIKMID